MYIKTIVKGMATNLYSGKRYQRATIEIVLVTVWKMPTQCFIIHEKGNHIKPVKIPTVIGREEWSMRKKGIAIEYTKMAWPTVKRNSASNSFFGLLLSKKFSPVNFDRNRPKYTMLPVPINIVQTAI